jgi:predicted SnoaL-like aldol condensation-catalyzing enzyme
MSETTESDRQELPMGKRLDNAKALYLGAIQDGNAEKAITEYSGARYTQHSTPVKDGQEGFIEFFADFHRRNPVRDIEIVRGFEDGSYVFLHVVQDLNNGEFRYVTADIFDTDDDAKMIEHWDMIDEMVDTTVSGHTQVDGPTEPTDLEKTEQNKTLVSGFLNDVLKGGDYDKLTSYISTDTYTQHNPNIGDGLDGLGAYVAELAEQGKSMVYEEIHKVIGSGDFVAALSKMNLGGVEMAVTDLFRVAEGRIVEHWDVMEEITPRNTWVNSGKF